LYGLAVTRPAGALGDSRAQVDESLAILRAVGDRRTFGKVLWCLAGINADLGDADTAAAQFEEALTLFIEFGDRWFCVLVLEVAAFLAASSQDVERAVRLLGAADSVLEDIGVPLLRRFQAPHGRALAESRASLGDGRFATAWNDGKHLSLGETVELVGAARTHGDPGTPGALTARELEVLALVADGRTDAEVAEELVVSVRTVHAHLRTIYRKLDLHTRSAATRYALEHGLAG
jgi:DNA-binding NarL/FixJ family response regulator